MRQIYKLYLFDFDYTLADSSKGIVLCFQKVLQHHGYSNVSDNVIKRTIGKTLEQAFCEMTGISDPHTLRLLRTEYTQMADTLMNVNTHLFPETADVLRKLKSQGADIGIISTKYRYRIADFFSSVLPKNFFNIIVGGEDVVTAKPSPEGLLLAIDRLRRVPVETLYVGDSLVDAYTAQAACVPFAGVTHGVTSASELACAPHVAIMSNLWPLVQ